MPHLIRLIGKGLISTFDGITKGNEWIGKVGGYITIGLTIIVMFYEVISRYVFNRPTSFSLEVATLCQVLLVAFASGYVLKEEGHVSIEIITEKVSDKVRNWMLCFTSIVSACLCAFFSLQMWKSAAWSLRASIYTDNMELPLAPLQFILFAGFILLTLQFIIRSHKHYKLARTVERPEEVR